MKILFFSQRFLFPMDTGGKIRTGNILAQLGQLADLTVISNVENEKDAEYIPLMDNLCKKFVAVPWSEPKRYTLGFYFRLALQSLSRYPVSVLNDFSPALEQALKAELTNEQYDLVVCDFLQSTLNFRDVEGVPTLLFQHNVEAQITQRHYGKAQNWFTRLFWGLQHRRMLRHEGRMCRRFDGIVAVSNEDKAIMENWYQAENVHVIPTGVDTDRFKPDDNIQEKKQLVFTGSMDWLPNEDAMAYFLESIFPLIKEEEPDTGLVIVGRRPTPKIVRMAQGRGDVQLTGWVDDTRPYISESAVYIVPIRIGGGTRMKIYEALAMRKALVSTTVGAEGLPLVDGEHIYRADTPEVFSKRVVELLRDGLRRRQLGEAAMNYVFENFRWKIVAERFLDICERVTATGNGR